MPVPSRRSLAQEKKLDAYTIICQSCRKPLWVVSNVHKYGTKSGATVTPYPDVPEYNTMWEKDKRTPKDVACPFCYEPYFKAIAVGDKMICRPMILEWDLLE
jgi:hypothetical protein